MAFTQDIPLFNLQAVAEIKRTWQIYCRHCNMLGLGHLPSCVGLVWGLCAWLVCMIEGRRIGWCMAMREWFKVRTFYWISLISEYWWNMSLWICLFAFWPWMTFWDMLAWWLHGCEIYAYFVILGHFIWYSIQPQDIWCMIDVRCQIVLLWCRENSNLVAVEDRIKKTETYKKSCCATHFLFVHNR